MQLARGNDKARPKTPIAVNAERLMMLTTVGMATSACITRLAIDIRLHRATIAGRHIVDATPHLEHGDPKFVPRNSRVLEERHFAEIASNVCAADANGMNLNERFAHAGRRRLVRFNSFPAFGFCEK